MCIQKIKECTKHYQEIKLVKKKLANAIYNNFFLDLFIQHSNVIVQIRDFFKNAYFKERNNMTKKPCNDNLLSKIMSFSYHMK